MSKLGKNSRSHLDEQVVNHLNGFRNKCLDELDDADRAMILAVAVRTSRLEQISNQVSEACL